MQYIPDRVKYIIDFINININRKLHLQRGYMQFRQVDTSRTFIVDLVRRILIYFAHE